MVEKQYYPIARRIRRNKIPAIRRDPSCCISDEMKARLNALRGSACIIWSLKKKQIEYIQEHYKDKAIKIEPHLFKIKVKRRAPHSRPANLPAIIKALARCSYDGETYLITHLKKSDQDILDSYDYKYEPIKYIISLDN